MQQVTDWLENLGLGQYAQRFAENDIDASVLPHLTDQSLKELGVSLGHRLKMLAAIKELSPPTPATPQPAAATEANPQDAAERRQVTVLFSDLVGSTALSARVDPEDLREVISAYQKCVAETVQRFGGYVAKFMVTAYSSISVTPRPARMTGECGKGRFGVDGKWPPSCQRHRRALVRAFSSGLRYASRPHRRETKRDVFLHRRGPTDRRSSAPIE